MILSFFGAAQEVTGSCYRLEACGKTFLIDCGMQQGQDEKENQAFPFQPADIDFVILTHAHIDHSGRLPLLVKQGFAGRIYSTKATCDLISIMLRDSAHIQEMDAKWENAKGRRAGKEEVTPLYQMADAENTLQYLSPCNYGEKLTLTPGIDVTFIDAGHILGSASVQLSLTENGQTREIVFSGDIGNINQPIIRDPQLISKADYVVMESTYGDRDHEASEDYVSDLAQIIDKTLGGGGNVVIPAFAVGRTQELLYFIREIKERKLVSSVTDFPVYIDSPLAREATMIYNGDLTGYADDQAVALMRRGIDPLRFSNLHLTESADESKALNLDTQPKVIISSSGMCDAGRVRHHLKHNLWRRECAVVFVGYQANGTLGRILLEGVKKVKLFGEEINVSASIYNFRGLSAHADRAGLLKWVHGFTQKPKEIFVIHGEEETCQAFAQALNKEGFSAYAPLYTARVDLVDGKVLEEGRGAEKQALHFERKKAVSRPYAGLLDASERLLDVIHQHEHATNRDIQRLTEELQRLTEEWEMKDA